jgi:hypothetical protein
LLIEPTVPNPGPTFPIVAADPEKAVRPSIPSAANKRLEQKTVAKYREIYRTLASKT